jgi:septal ring factor EnvC (AmiA/AmiB activator)
VDKEVEKKRKELHQGELFLKDLSHKIEMLKKEIGQIDEQIKKSE